MCDFVKIPRTDYNIFCSVLQLFNEKRGVRDATITRNEIIEISGVSKSFFAMKIANSYKRKIEKEENIA